MDLAKRALANITGKSLCCMAILAGLPLAAQNGAFAAPPFQNQPAPTQPLLSVGQLSNLIAPVALYPDPLLGLVLAAATYPLEIVEAQQWLQQNRNLSGEQLIQAAKQQNWDPSVQTLVGFPDAMALLTRDIRWTTDVGNAFLSQQQDVMAAIQTMRMRAQSNGRLVNGPQQFVTNEVQNGEGQYGQVQYGQSAIAIQPANPEVIYVPSYNPQTIWGPPAEGSYPPLGYPVSYAPNGYGAQYQYPSSYSASYSAPYSSSYYSAPYQANAGGAGYSSGGYGGSNIGSGIAYGAGVILNTLFTGLTHFSPWGWVLNWAVHALFLNPGFFHSNGFHGYDSYGGGYGAVAWVHNPVHRLGIAYPSHFVAGRIGGGYGAREGEYSRGFSGASGFRSEAFRAEAFRPSGYNANSYAPRGEFRPQNFTAPTNRASIAPGFNDRVGPYGGRNGGGFAGNTRGYASPAPRQYAQNFGGSNFGNRSGGAGHFSEPKMPSSFGGGHAGHFSAPKAPHFSAPHSSGGHGGGHSGGGHSGKSSRHR